ncbi:MAG: hypothetical protein ABW007_23635 [Chitinophagaceae bacterium]
MTARKISQLFAKRNDRQLSTGGYWFAMATGIIMPRIEDSNKYIRSDYFNTVT